MRVLRVEIRGQHSDRRGGDFMGFFIISINILVVVNAIYMMPGCGLKKKVQNSNNSHQHMALSAAFDSGW